MGLLKKLFVKSPNYQGQTMFEKELPAVVEVVTKHMTAFLGENLQPTQNMSNILMTQLSFKSAKSKYTVMFMLSKASETQTQANINLMNYEGNAEEHFKDLVAAIN